MVTLILVLTKDIKRYPYSKDLDQYKIEINDILLCMTGGTVGKSTYVDNLLEDSYINQRVALIRINSINSRYFYSILLSPYISEIINKNKTSTNDNISMKLIENFFIPLPPKEEQIRIVNYINKIDPLLEKYKCIESKLTKLEIEFPDKLKKSILQYAIEGKLVKQNERDEPTSVLLDNIKKEKDKLIKEGKIKQDKTETNIILDDDKNYYENIPLNWYKTTLSKVISMTSGTDLKPEEYSSNNIGIPYITGASNVDANNNIIINRFTNKRYVNSYLNEILLSCKGTIGKIVINNIGDIHIARQFMSIRSFINNEYIVLFLNSLVCELNIESRSMIPGIDRQQILSKIIILPPLNEQKRIVEKVKIILNQI